MKKLYLFFLLCIPYFAFSQVNITVQANTVIKDVSHHPVGINVDYLMDDDSYLKPEKSTVNTLKEMGVKFLRFPGGEKSDNYLWSQYPYTSANPTLALSDTCHWPNKDPRFVLDDHKSLKPTTLDFDEFMLMVKATGTEPLIVVNGDAHWNTGSICNTAPPRDSLLVAARQWVRYANVVKKYKIKYWMIGNESYHSAAYYGAVTAKNYLADLIAFATAMKAEDPSIKIVVNGLMDSWWKTILSNRQAASLIDYLGVSVYPIDNWSAGYDHYRTAAPALTSSVSTAAAAINKYVANATDRQRIKIIATEFNTIDWAENGWPNNNDVGHALVAFDMLGQLLKIPKLDLAFFWNTRYVDNREIPFNVYDALSSNGNLQANGLALSIWGNYLLDKMVAVNSSSSIASYASKNDTQLNVFLLNKHTSATTINLKLSDFTSTGTAQKYTYKGTSVSDTQPAFLPAGSITSKSGDAAAYTLKVDPTSVTVLSFTRAQPVVQKVSSFTLVNADNDQDLQVLTSGATLNLAALPTKNLNIRANTVPAVVGSVVLQLSGALTRTVTESSPPYSLFGDTEGNYKNWTPAAGSYTLKATPYTKAGGSGLAGNAQSISFTVINQSPASTPALIRNITAATGKHYALTKLAPGKRMYTDRSYTITAVPPDSEGALLIQPPDEDKWRQDTALLSFDVAEDAMVYVAYDAGATALPAWLMSWQKSNEKLGVDASQTQSMILYKKAFAAGRVTLGGNMAGPAQGAQKNYLVVALPLEQALSAGDDLLNTTAEKENGLRLFPNPSYSGHTWQVALSQFRAQERITITVYELGTGRRLFLHQLQADNAGAAFLRLPLLQPLKPGLYLVSAVAGSGKHQAKLLVLE